MAAPRSRLVAGLIGVAFFAAGCSGGSNASVRRGGSAPAGTPSSGQPRSFADPVAMPMRLERPVTFENGHLRLAPAFASDSTRVTYAQAVRRVRSAVGSDFSFTKSGSPARPIVVLARYTDVIEASQSSSLPGPSHAFNDPNFRLVVAVVFYGPPTFGVGGATGGTGPPETGPSTYETNLWLLDPETGRTGDLAVFSGPLPRISTAPLNG